MREPASNTEMEATEEERLKEEIKIYTTNLFNAD